MIFSLTEYDVYTGLNSQSSITDLVNIESNKPSSDFNSAYARISIVSNESKTPTNRGYIHKEARISITIVSPLHTNDNDTPESVIDVIIDTITNSIVGEHDQKNIDRNGKGVISCTEGPTSPMLYDEKNRPRRVKDYFITYIASDV